MEREIKMIYERDWYDPGYPVIGYIEWQGYKVYSRNPNYCFLKFLWMQEWDYVDKSETLEGAIEILKRIKAAKQ